MMIVEMMIANLIRISTIGSLVLVRLFRFIVIVRVCLNLDRLLLVMVFMILLYIWVIVAFNIGMDRIATTELM